MIHTCIWMYMYMYMELGLAKLIEGNNSTDKFIEGKQPFSSSVINYKCASPTSTAETSTPAQRGVSFHLQNLPIKLFCNFACTELQRLKASCSSWLNFHYYNSLFLRLLRHRRSGLMPKLSITTMSFCVKVLITDCMVLTYM